MSNKLVGFTGKGQWQRAEHASKRASANPHMLCLADGTCVGCGDDVLCTDANGYPYTDYVLYGARGTHQWASEARKAGRLAP
jgi:hypothetical protein